MLDTDGLGRLRRRRASTRSSTSPGSRRWASRWSEPLRYYTVNVGGTASLLRAMDAAGVRRPGVLVVVHGLRRPGAHPGGRDAPGAATQPVRAHQAVHRGHAARPRRQRRPLADRCCCATSTRSAPTRAAAWARTPRHPQQPHAVRDAGGGGPPAVRAGVRRRLPHPRRHRHPRLHPRRRPGRRATSPPSRPLGRRRLRAGQPRHRHRAARCSR